MLYFVFFLLDLTIKYVVLPIEKDETFFIKRLVEIITLIYKSI